jgi:hypothetical protein
MTTYNRNAFCLLALMLLGGVWLVYTLHEADRTRGGPQAQQINCVNNLKQIGLSFKTWALDHHDKFPFNLSTNEGGTRELCVTGADGFDTSVSHFIVMSNELSNPMILVCPQDEKKKPATSFNRLDSAHVTYRLRTGTNIDDTNPAEILMVCPIDGNILKCDGTVNDRNDTPR